ncbi:MAG: RdgB/HAM1 family non-canonical purine NTP pyrophosphatase [Methanocorpusculum sp.]|nr:RdgB/HAM1 family non-canonical purine NTP pyrophosphatase [Methanocorpusculum sp.]
MSVTKYKIFAFTFAAFFAGITEVTHVAFEAVEPQSESIEEVARAKAVQAYAALKRPLIIDDTGLFIEELNGFPGPYAAYVQDTLGNAAVLRLMQGVENRRAYFSTVIAYADESGIRTFEGRVGGEITDAPRGDAGFGYDPIFSVGEKTLSEMSMREKNMISHRARALAKFRAWYLSSR